MLNSIRSNNHRELSRTISHIENDQDISPDYFIQLHPYIQQSIRIGITGPPGVGKSSLVDCLIPEILSQDKSVGVVAVDPTSPFSGGALLGDRIRMNRFYDNNDVYIRSMGSHQYLGGLAKKAQDVGDVIAASGKDIIIFETVGIGQAEHDVVKAVDLTVVVLMPGTGDEIQLMKAGLMEIADIFVINKTDKKGANRLAQTLQALLHSFSKPDSLEPPVINTIASTGEGVFDWYKLIEDHLKEMDKRGILESKRLERHRERIRGLIQDRLLSKFWSSHRLEQLEKATQSVASIQSSPYEIAEEFLTAFKNG
ncbi:MAG: methylmalonyl Co-A mutase-associated GTPase MeaB [Candidatus Marinimicrobia bacterium]|jgi:LAO/AO transport system kinase|nr:methylmalonyl Co-A mutase-associated GTPase MeaB [Candidatus Neomarinimicrobiota bacterium]|tara:strand:+ start:733 stop:1665 length:933 start_codon:yes stop_codon:yes gene_type:complete